MDQNLQATVAGIVFFIILSLIISFLLFLCYKYTPKNHPQTPLPVTRHPSQPLSDTSPTISTSFDPALRQVSMAELLAATNGFDPELIIGDGSFGLVYKATLSAAGVTVAVKKLDQNAFQGLREFRAEMETLGKLRHPNLVKMLGYCVSGSDRILIYEFIEKGSLDQWLQDMSSSFNSLWVPLSWDLRIKIIRGVVNGLAFLHGLDTVIVHRDIKASNILLDNEFEAHIADFGLARRIEGAHSHVSTQAAGTMGYMPPEYLGGCTLATVKGDVYSFGILMFEVGTGKRPNWPVREEGRDIWMLEWAKNKIAENKYVEIIDTSLPRKGLREDEIYEYFKIANLCTSQNPKERPPMCDVAKMLDRISICT